MRIAGESGAALEARVEKREATILLSSAIRAPSIAGSVVPIGGSSSQVLDTGSSRMGGDGQGDLDFEDIEGDEGDEGDKSDWPEPEDSGYSPPKTEMRGYRIERELGRGGMGTVYLARQLSLDRFVALKVLSRRWDNDPQFIARFTREAFAAAQLNHPNIVQIHDIGEVDGGRFFSMEYVPGRSLAQVVRTKGKLDPETAVGYVLQAARGLKHAHDRGMIHRDVKPDNLLIDRQGLVKVADLGLVKTAEVEPPRPGLRTSGASGENPMLTGARIALGTPAYMSPEQCRDAGLVDCRADIYSLGCTLYVLVTGRPPFQGTTAIEVMTKQAYEPIVPPDQIVARIPAELSAIIQRMMAKNPGDRFQRLDDVILTLEAWLGIRHAGGFCPREEEISKLEGSVHAYTTAPRAVLRNRVLKGAFALASLAAILLLFFHQAAWSFGIGAFVVQAAAAYFVVQGIGRKGPLFRRVRSFLFGLRLFDWALAAAGVGLFFLLLAASDLLGMWLGFGMLGIVLAAAVYWGLDRPAAAERNKHLVTCEKLLSRLRARGLDEWDLRQFVAKFAGRHWEEFFEALFGYEEKLAARGALLQGLAAGAREKHAAWREPIIAAINRVEAHRKAVRERRVLAAVEQARLVAEGAAREEAERQARATAEAMVRGADRMRRAESEPARSPVGVGTLLDGAEGSDFAFEAAPPDRLGRLAHWLVGPHVRAILAAVLLAACGLWANQNGFLPGGDAPAQLQAAVESQDLSRLEPGAALSPPQQAAPLEIANIPPRFTRWAESWNVGIAGLLLLGSLGFRGNAMSLLALLGGGIAAFGHHLGIRSVEPVSNHHIALLLGVVLSLAGFRCSRR